MIRTRTFVWILFLLVVPASIFGQESDKKLDVESDIIESVFRYQIKQCAENTTLTVFSLSIYKNDPSDEFMKRFAKEAVTIRKKSDLAQTEQTHEFIDKESGRFAALLDLNKLKVLEDGIAEVTGSCVYADWAARTYKYRLIREENRWIVKRADLYSVM